MDKEKIWKLHIKYSPSTFVDKNIQTSIIGVIENRYIMFITDFKSHYFV